MKAGKDYQIVPFDRNLHTAFVFGTFHHSLQGGREGLRDPQFPWKHIPPRLLIDHIKKLMAQPGTVCLVAVDAANPAVLLGWAATRPADNEVVFAFVGYEKRRFKIGSSLILAGGVDVTRDAGVLFWTRVTQRIARRPGYQLYFRCSDTAEPAPAVAAQPKGKPKAA